jgi:hypothetical protein
MVHYDVWDEAGAEADPEQRVLTLGDLAAGELIMALTQVILAGLLIVTTIFGYRRLPLDQKALARSPKFWMSLGVLFASYASVFVASGGWRLAGGAAAVAAVYYIATRYPARPDVPDEATGKAALLRDVGGESATRAESRPQRNN